MKRNYLTIDDSTYVILVTAFAKSGLKEKAETIRSIICTLKLETYKKLKSYFRK